MSRSSIAGIVGLGKMGAPIARRLLHQGVSLVAFDIDSEALQRIEEHGATAADSPRDVANQCDFILTVLPNGPHVESVADGDTGILATDNADLNWLEMSTIDPEVSKGLGKRCQKNGIRFLDTAIGGLTVDAEAGKLLFMVGGTDEEFDIASGFLTHLGRCVHCGPTGSGVTIKLINNQLAGVTLAATIEALLIGRKTGLRFKAMKEILSGTAADNAHLHRALPERIIPRDFDDGFSMDLMIKDAGLAIDLADRLQSPNKLGKLVQDIRQGAIDKGWNGKDTTIIAKVFEEMANADLAFDE